MDKKMRSFRLSNSDNEKLHLFGEGNKSKGIRNILFLVKNIIGEAQALDLIQRKIKNERS